MVLKCIKGLAPPNLCEKLTSIAQVYSRNSRYRDKLNVLMLKSATGQHSFSYRASRLCNDFKESISVVNSQTIFKKVMKSMTLEQFL